MTPTEKGIAALKVLTLSPRFKEYLELYDRKALEQAEQAIVALEPKLGQPKVIAETTVTVPLDNGVETRGVKLRQLTDDGQYVVCRVYYHTGETSHGSGTYTYSLSAAYTAFEEMVCQVVNTAHRNALRLEDRGVLPSA